MPGVRGNAVSAMGGDLQDDELSGRPSCKRSRDLQFGASSGLMHLRFGEDDGTGKAEDHKARVQPSAAELASAQLSPAHVRQTERGSYPMQLLIRFACLSCQFVAPGNADSPPMLPAALTADTWLPASPMIASCCTTWAATACSLLAACLGTQAPSMRWLGQQLVTPMSCIPAQLMGQ